MKSMHLGSLGAALFGVLVAITWSHPVAALHTTSVQTRPALALDPPTGNSHTGNSITCAGFTAGDRTTCSGPGKIALRLVTRNLFD